MSKSEVEKAASGDKQLLRDALSSKSSSGASKQFVEPKDNNTTIIDDTKHAKNIHEDNTSKDNGFKSTTSNRKRQNPEDIERLDDFLYGEYDGHCQVCGDTFSVGNKNFFKKRSLNLGKNRDVNRKGNTLCLCPKHWEVFNHNLADYSFNEAINGIEKMSIELLQEKFEVHDLVDKDDMKEPRDAFYMLDDDDPFSMDGVFFLPIKMFSKTEYIKFTKAHMMEFVEVWNNN